MRGVEMNELCTKMDEECAEMRNSMQGWESTANSSSELSARYSDQCRAFEERNTILVRDNERLEDLQFYMMSSMLAGTSLRQHQEGVLMHYCSRAPPKSKPWRVTFRRRRLMKSQRLRSEVEVKIDEPTQTSARQGTNKPTTH
jgi:hypothetical protein